MTVLVGYVPSPEGEAALRAAGEEAHRRGEPLLVVNATRGDAYADPGFAQQHDLERVRGELTGRGVIFGVHQVIGGRDPAIEIIELAESADVSLLVIGLRPRNPLGKLILGSAAQRILLEAACPILAVKAR